MQHLMSFNNTPYQKLNSKPKNKKPNIIMIISDEQNAGILGCAGDP